VSKVIVSKFQKDWSIRTKVVSTDVQHQHDDDNGPMT